MQCSKWCIGFGHHREPRHLMCNYKWWMKCKSLILISSVLVKNIWNCIAAAAAVGRGLLPNHMISIFDSQQVCSWKQLCVIWVHSLWNPMRAVTRLLIHAGLKIIKKGVHATDLWPTPLWGILVSVYGMHSLFNCKQSLILLLCFLWRNCLPTLALDN